MASPDVFEDTGADVTVTWSNIDLPESTDWIGVYCGTEAGVSPNNVLDWMYVQDVSSDGVAVFHDLINMRCNYFFRYYRDLPTTGEYELLAESNEIVPRKGVNAPMHGRLSVTNKQDDILVTWTSNSIAQVQHVHYSLDCAGLTELTTYNTVENTTMPTTYVANDMCGSPANVTYQYLYRPVGYFHSALLHSLSPNSVYCYQYGNSVDGFSDLSYFRTSPGVGKYRTNLCTDVYQSNQYTTHLHTFVV